MIQSTLNSSKTDLNNLSLMINNQECKTTYLNSKQLVKAFNSITKISFNDLNAACTLLIPFPHYLPNRFMSTCVMQQKTIQNEQPPVPPSFLPFFPLHG